MSRKHLKGFTVRPSEGSRRNQKWGSASGHSIRNEGEVSYRFLTEDGSMSRATTQVGDVKRPLAAVSRITQANNIAFFCDDCDYIINRKDPVAEKIIELVKQASLKTKMYKQKGTYRIRAWIVPESQKGGKKSSGPFGRPGP